MSVPRHVIRLRAAEKPFQRRYQTGFTRSAFIGDEVPVDPISQMSSDLQDRTINNNKKGKKRNVTFECNCTC